MIGCPLNSFGCPVHVSSYLRDYQSLYGFAHRFASSFRPQTLPCSDFCRSSASTTAASSDTSCKNACDWGQQGGTTVVFSQSRQSWPFSFGIHDRSGASSQMNEHLHVAGHHQRHLEAIGFASSTRPVSRLYRPRRGSIELLRPRSMSP